MLCPVVEGEELGEQLEHYFGCPNKTLSVCITLSPFCSRASICIQQCEGSLCTTQMLTGRILFQKSPGSDPS